MTQELEEAQAKKKAQKEAKRKKDRAKRKAAQAAKKAAQAKKEEEEAKAKATQKRLAEERSKPVDMWGKQLTQRDILARAAEQRIRKMVGARHKKQSK